MLHQPPSRFRTNFITTLFAAFALMFCAGAGADDNVNMTHKTGEVRKVSVGEALTIELVWCPPGEFDMGSPENEPDRCDDEGPQHHVTLTKGFWIGKFEVTIGLWRAVMGSVPGRDKDQNLPVNRVSWNDCQNFLKRLSKATGIRFRLPTEAEWEYACRAGTTTPFAGKASADLGWYITNSDRENHPVGKKKPNGWGIHDMHGNVWEWCQDFFDAYPSDSVIDPVGPDKGEERVYRGGCSWRPVADARSAYRNYDAPTYKQGRLGLRIAADEQPAITTSKKP